MTILTQTDCCTMLGIDPKTLRNWLRQANLQWTQHPTDARLKCLTEVQVQQLAILHDRPLASSLPASSGQQDESRPLSTPRSLPNSGPLEDELGQSLLGLQARVATMQEQLTQLALELLREREFRLELQKERTLHTEQRLRALEALLTPAGEPSPASPTPQKAPVPDDAHLTPNPVHPSPLPGSVRGRRGVLPLIAYTAAGSYVVICPVNGELPLLPDTPEWFDWLATLSSFRFLGRLGRLSASRTKGRSCWMAYRRIHRHRYDSSLGSTSRLTIAHLEQMAATLQSYLPSLS